MKRAAIAKLGTVAAALSLAVSAGMFAPNASAAPGQGDWLMVVKSVNVDPSREEAFNRWYDEIDIPDVLEVPGYMRARRGERADHSIKNSSTDAADSYLALYDICSANIDKTIIAMLMASWRMDQLGRSTDLIKVVERVYYRRLAPPIAEAGKNGGRWLFLVRTDRSPGPGQMARLAAAKRFQHATRYGLDRVLMHEPRSVPAFLTVFEIEADTREQAGIAADAIGSALAGHDQGLYRLIKDEMRP